MLCLIASWNFFDLLKSIQTTLGAKTLKRLTAKAVAAIAAVGKPITAALLVLSRSGTPG